jgi:TPP-dependent indolepyruvate ferredoxin oxidoreductase alpha subunit
MIEERMEKMGYDEKLKDTDKVRLVENPKKFVEEYLESILSKKTKENDVLEKDEEGNTKISPIIRRQINVLLNTLKDNGISPSVILKHTEDNE